MRYIKAHPYLAIGLLSILTISTACFLEKSSSLISALALSQQFNISYKQHLSGTLIEKKSSTSLITARQESGKELVATLKRGENMDDLLQRCRVPSSNRAQIVSLLARHVNFRQMKPGDRFSVELDGSGEVQRGTYESGSFDIVSINRKGASSFEAKKIPVVLENQTVNISGIIDSSLFSAFESQGESQQLILAFADIFASHIDFNTEPQKGDRFSVVVQKYFRDSQFVGYGRILAARYESDRKVFDAYYYGGQDQGSYFDGSGQQLGTTFLRSPVPFGRMTSGFTMSRKHPILGGYRPHLGIDLAAPEGTPIMATADGVIEFKGYNGGYGKQVILRHHGGYRTYYGHLSRFAQGLGVGSTVRQKDIIGNIGSTGLATGPHIDYRIEENGDFKNPFSVKFRPVVVLKGKTMETFAKEQKGLATLLDGKDAKPVRKTETITVTSKNSIFLL